MSAAGGATNGPGKSAGFYARCGAAGATAAALSHIVMVPVDVAKTRIQLDPARYPSFARAAQTIVREEGLARLGLGFGPTAAGYAVQGWFKYGLYEVFKARAAGVLGHDVAEKYATGVYLASGICAEAIADVALAPFEAVRIRMVAQPAWARGTADGMRLLYSAEGVAGLYRGLPLLMMKQIPYTAVKFAVNEATVDYLYSLVPSSRIGSMSKSEQLLITAAGGLVGGVASAVASHPADTLLSKVNAGPRAGAGVWAGMAAAARDLGWRGVWRGLVPRMGMVGVLAAFQLLAYDATKVLFHLPVSQGVRARTGHQG